MSDLVAWDGGVPDLDRHPFFGVTLARLTPTTFVELIRASVGHHRCLTYSYVHFHTVNLMEDAEPTAEAFRRIDILTPDGIAALWSTRWLGSPFSRDNIIVMEYSMTVLAPTACDQKWSVYLFGGDFGVAEAAAARLRAQYPDLHIAGTHHGQIRSTDEMERVVCDIAARQPTVLLVGLGQPLQERWINQHRDRLRAHAIVGVGGYLEKLARRDTVYPAWVNRTHLYWLHRLLTEPARVWRRYTLGAGKYAWRLARAVALARTTEP